MAIATEAPAISHFLINEVTLFSARVNSLPDELLLVRRRFPGSSFSKGRLAFSTAPGLLLTSEINKINNIIFRFRNNSNSILCGKIKTIPFQEHNKPQKLQ